MLLNKNWQDHPLMVGDRQFEFGFWVHADSALTFALDGNYERFEAFVGEDKDRADGLVRFRVLPAAVPLPASWPDLARDFPRQTGWLQADAGIDGLTAWFGPRENVALEQDVLARALRDAPPIRHSGPNWAPWLRPVRASATRAGSICTPAAAATVTVQRW